jgi:beta-lactamase regulating signal transducer with metallopeptidase domain
MTFLLNCAIQVTVILSIALGVLPLLRKKSAALRHDVLSTAMVFSILTPVFNLVMPVWSLSAVVSQHPAVVPIREQISALTSPVPQTPEPGVADAAPSGLSVESDQVRNSLWLSSWPALVWATGAFAGLVVLFTGLVRLARVVSASVPMPNGIWRQLAGRISSEYGLKSVVHLLESRNSSVLVTWGAIRPRVVLPAGSAEWSEERARIVLRHELAHVRRADWIVQMIAQTVRILFWFNPLVWIVCCRLRLESECACDDIVLSRDINGHEYAEHLLDLARVLNRPGQSWSAALSMARLSTIERRFSAMLDPGLNRYPVNRFALFSMVAVGLALTLSLSAANSATPIGPVAESAAVAPVPVPTAAPVPVEPPAAKPGEPAAVPTFRQSNEPASRDRTSTQQFFAEVVQNFAGGASERRRGRALDRALLEVAEEGDVFDIEELLRAGADVNAVIPGDGTPLIAAAGDGQLEAVRYLLDRGADPNLAASGDGNPLIVAADEGHMQIVRLLLDRGANPNAAVPGDGNPLIAAAAEGHTDIVTLLLDRGASIDEVVPGDENPLIQASAEGRLNVVRLLVSRRADVNVRVWAEGNPWRPGEWRTPLSVARREGHEDVVQFLLSVGARD